MKIKLLGAAMGIVLSAAAISASAQKKINEGVVTYNVNAGGQNIESKIYFRGDSTYSTFQMGPANVKTIATGNGEYLAVLVDVPVANMKKAGIGTPGEVEEEMAKLPKLTFTKTAETKVINGFNCTKVVAKDAANNNTFDAWVTKDIAFPSNMYTKSFAEVGVPVQFTSKAMGQTVEMTLKTVTEEKVPAGSFGIPAGYDKMTLGDLKSLQR